MGIPVKLEAFEGPLDLLLHLISKHKMNIFDIEISSLLEQYMNYLEAAKSMDMVTFLFTSGLVVIAVISLLRGMIDNAIKMVSPTMLMETYADLPAALATRLGIILVIFSVIGIFVGRIPQKKENMLL